MLEGKKVCFFWQSGRLLANQSDTQAAVNYCTIFHPDYSSELRESVQRMPATLLDKLQLWCGWIADL
jgi:hypothetical protein